MHTYTKASYWTNLFHPFFFPLWCMIFVYTPQHHHVKDNNIQRFPFPFIWKCSACRMFLYQSYMYECKLYNYFNGIFCYIGNFKSFRFLSTLYSSLCIKLLKSFFRFSPLQWSAVELSKRFDDEMCFPPVNTFCVTLKFMLAKI